MANAVKITHRVRLTAITTVCALAISARNGASAETTVTTYSSESHSTTSETHDAGTMTGASSISRSGPGGTVITSHATSHFDVGVEGLPIVDISGEAYRANACDRAPQANANAERHSGFDAPGLNIGTDHAHSDASAAGSVSMALVNASDAEIAVRSTSIRVAPHANFTTTVATNSRLVILADDRCLMRLVVRHGATTITFSNMAPKQTR